jgi:hypothetical protein
MVGYREIFVEIVYIILFLTRDSSELARIDSKALYLTPMHTPQDGLTATFYQAPVMSGACFHFEQHCEIFILILTLCIGFVNDLVLPAWLKVLSFRAIVSGN